MKLISIYYKEENNSRARAEVIREDREKYSIHYYHANGDLFKTESFDGKSVNYVENLAENWASNIQNLNG